jgi:hypothetical protein
LVETVVPGESADLVIFKADTLVIKSLKCNVIYYQRLAPAYTGGLQVSIVNVMEFTLFVFSLKT